MSVPKGKYQHHVKRPRSFVGGKWKYTVDVLDIKVLAISGVWAMVRRPRSIPYVCPVSELVKVEPAEKP